MVSEISVHVEEIQGYQHVFLLFLTATKCSVAGKSAGNKIL